MSRQLFRRQQRHHFLHVWAILLVIIVGIVGAWAGSVAFRVRSHSLPVGDIQLSVPYSTYLLGEPITFTIKNNYNSAIYLANDCPSEPLSVYRLENNVWVRIHDTAPIATCPKEDRQIQIPGGGAVNGNFTAWHNLFNIPGKYRVVAYVEYYAALPFQEFDVIATPRPYVAVTPVAPATTSAGASRSSSNSTNSGSGRSSSGDDSPSTVRPASPASSTPTPVQYVPKNYVLDVNSSGNYALTSLSVHVNDTITIVYTKPYTNEVITSFTPVSPTSSSIRSVTVDSEFTSRTFTVTTAGTWRYRATDHSGNSGTLFVH